MNTCATCNASHKNTVDRVLRAGFAWLGRTEIATGDRLGITPMSPAAEGRPVDISVRQHEDEYELRFALPKGNS